MAILRSGLFERVSTEEQAKFGYSIKTQVEALEEYCTKNRIKIVDHYCDEGVSAGKPYKKRPEMKRLLDDVESGKIDIILFTRLDRWFRNVPEYFKVQEILDKNKVEWRAIWEDYDTTTANGRMAITIFLAIAQNEREKTSERITAVFEAKRKNKESFFGPSSTPFGYIEEYDKNGIRRLVKDPTVREALQDFWNIAVKYNNITRAAKTVNLDYGLTKSKHKWIELSKKEIYTGNYRGVEGYCPAYVSKEDWLILQDGRTIKKTQNNRVYLFTGLIMFPECGKRLTSKYCRQTRKNGEKVEYFSYRCPDHDINLCKYNRTISQNKLEKWLLIHLDTILEKEIAIVNIAKSKPRPKPKTNINALKEQLRKLEVVYMAGNKTDEEYLQEQRDIKEAIKKAENEEPMYLADKDISHLQKVLETDFRAIYDTLDQEDKRRFWRQLIKGIHVKGNEVVSVDI